MEYFHGTIQPDFLISFAFTLSVQEPLPSRFQYFVQPRQSVSIQIISSCHFHRFHYTKRSRYRGILQPCSVQCVPDLNNLVPKLACTTFSEFWLPSSSLHRTTFSPHNFHMLRLSRCRQCRRPLSLGSIAQMNPRRASTLFNGVVESLWWSNANSSSFLWFQAQIVTRDSDLTAHGCLAQFCPHATNANLSLKHLQ